MGIASSFSLSPEAIDDLCRETGFTRHHLVRLNRRFLSLDTKNKGTLSREDFTRIRHLALNAVREFVVNAFFIDRKTGRALNSVDFRQFVRTMAVFRPAKESSTPSTRANSRQSKLTLAFRLLDTDSDGKLSREELIAVLKMMVRINVTEEQLSRIADRAIEEADLDGDGFIGFEEFIEATEKLPVEERLSLRFLL